MKIADLYYRVRDGFRYIISFGRYNPSSQSGQQAILYEMQRKAVEAAQKVDIPGTQSNKSQSQEVKQPSFKLPWTRESDRIEQPGSVPNGDTSLNIISEAAKFQEPRNDPFYPEYKCKTNDALGCYYPQQTLQQTPAAKFCLGCGFPVPLSENLEIRGRRGIYQTGALLGKRGMGRIYGGIQKNDNQPIVIKEFLLPNRCFKNLEDIQQRQATFVRVANITSADGRDRDFRLIIPYEAIADEQEKRCYLITKGNFETLPNLSSYLSIQGGMTTEQVKLLLDQLLQTLEFLHGQRFQLASGQIQEGLVHGNINLDSVLIYESNQQDFFVYLTDLLLWEYLFYRPDTQISPKTVTDDLVAVGEIGFKMLVGQSGTSSRPQVNLDPRNEQHWPSLEPKFKQFMLQLLGLNSSFNTATSAREVLLKLPGEKFETPNQLPLDNEQDKSKKPWLPWVIAPAIIVLSLIAGGIIWRTVNKPNYLKQNTVVLIPTIDEINVPEGNFTYTTEQEGTASYILLKPSLLSTRRSLIDELQQRKPGLILQVIGASNDNEAASFVEQGAANFAVVSQTETSPSPVESQAIAYDGLLIVVPFSYEQRERGLPKALGGKITFEQVRELYSGKIKNWQELGGPDLPVKLYIPTEPSAIQLFEEKVLQNQSAIATFRALINQREIKKLETFQTLQTLQYEFENQQVGGISFGLSSKIFGQCGGYPLALQVKSESAFIAFFKRLLFLDEEAEQVWIQPDNRRIDPSTNLCKKGSYQLAENLFQTGEYPLSFPLVVLYPRDNRDEPEYQIGRKFAQMLMTEEGQRLLQETNLVPIQPLK